MIFRPRLFISSTFSENEDLRDKIRSYFISIGGEPLLYEHELTPSVMPNTYRNDVLDADFVILIIKEEYGTQTDTGLSGIHEEYLIAKNHNIPMHVYIKKQSTEIKGNKNPLIDEIKNKGVSYYYFENDEDLLKRMQETTFTIAKEIMLSKVSVENLPHDMLAKTVGQLDYERGIVVVSIIESVKEHVKRLEMDWIYSNIIVELFDKFNYEFGMKEHNFINWKLDDKMREMLRLASTFSIHSAEDFIANNNYRNVEVPIIGKLDFCSVNNRNGSTWGHNNYLKALRSLNKKYKEFKVLLEEVLLEASIVK